MLSKLIKLAQFDEPSIGAREKLQAPPSRTSEISATLKAYQDFVRRNVLSKRDVVH
jgi:hypothetical protein